MAVVWYNVLWDRDDGEWRDLCQVRDLSLCFVYFLFAAG